MHWENPTKKFVLKKRIKSENIYAIMNYDLLIEELDQGSQKIKQLYE